MTKNNPSAETIDAILPQTQCGLCGFGGCLPYAQALAENSAEINLCPPGGVEGLRQLGKLLDKDPAPFLEAMKKTAKPEGQIAVIREAECIGCTKCITACPVDAILGAAKQLHTVIANECSGCELCIPVCPVDCIDLTQTANQNLSPQHRQQYKNRFINKQKRLTGKKTAEKTARGQQLKKNQKILDQRQYVADAVARALHKKNLASPAKK